MQSCNSHRKEYCKRYYQQNKEHILKIQKANKKSRKELSETQLDKRKAIDKRYYESHKEAIRAKQQRYYQQNKERIKANVRKNFCKDRPKQQWRLTPEYHQWRQAIYDRDQHICQDCGIMILGPVHAHHIKEANKYPKLKFDINNGISLCEECHRLRHTSR